MYVNIYVCLMSRIEGLNDLAFYVQALNDPPGEISITELVVVIAVTVWSVTQRASKKQVST